MHLECKVTMRITYFIICSFNQHIGEAELLFGLCIHLLLPVQCLVIEMIICIIFECGFGNRIASRHINIGCIHCITVCRKCIGTAFIRKLEM